MARYKSDCTLPFVVRNIMPSPSVILHTCGCCWGVDVGRAGNCHPGVVCPDVVACCEDSKRSLSARTASSSNCSLPFSARSLLSCTGHNDNNNIDDDDMNKNRNNNSINNSPGQPDIILGFSLH